MQKTSRAQKKSLFFIMQNKMKEERQPARGGIDLKDSKEAPVPSVPIKIVGRWRPVLGCGSYRDKANIIVPYFCIQFLFKTGNLRERLVLEFDLQLITESKDLAFLLDFITKYKPTKIRYSADGIAHSIVNTMYEDLVHNKTTQEQLTKSFRSYQLTMIDYKTPLPYFLQENLEQDPDKTLLFGDRQFTVHKVFS